MSHFEDRDTALAFVHPGNRHSERGCPHPRFGGCSTGYNRAMDHLTAGTWRRVADYLQEEVPWELERLESVSQLVNSWPDWAYAASGSHRTSYSSLLRDSYGPFVRSAARGLSAERLRSIAGGQGRSRAVGRVSGGVCDLVTAYDHMEVSEVNDRTDPDGATRQAELSDAAHRHEADRAATGDEAQAADEALSKEDSYQREAVAEHEKEMMEIGATIKGEGEIK